MDSYGAPTQTAAPAAPAPGLEALPLGMLLPTPVRPKYPAWYKPDPKPSIEKILRIAKEKDVHFLERNLAIAETIAVLRQHVSGAFMEDVRARELGKKEGYVSTSLVDEHNALTAMIAGIDLVYQRKVTDPKLKMKAQMLEDACYDWREKAERQWVKRGDMTLRVAEAKVLTAYGFLVTRTTCDLYDPDYPFDSALIDPATVYPEWQGKRGLSRVLRIYKTRLVDAVYDFMSDSSMTAQVRARLKKLENGEIDDCDTELVEVVEYWDRTWCAVVLMDGTVLKQPSEHKYGLVPYTITYGPGGEPMFTTPQDYFNRRDMNGRIQPYKGDGINAHSRYKATSSIRAGMIRNAQEEALASLVVEEIRKAANPPVIWERTAIAAKNPNKIVIDGRRGGITEALAGEEKLVAFPTTPNPGLLQMMVQFMGKNAQSNSMPMSLMGQINQSNVSGTAINSSADSGMDKISVWIASMESHYQEEAEMKARIWRNVGHLSQYISEQPQLYQLPDPLARAGDAPVRLLTPELLDELGFPYAVTVRMKKVRNGELIMMGNALKMLNDANLMSLRTGSEYLGISDFDREQEQIREERTVNLAFQNQKFLEIVTIPLAMEQQIAALAGNPEAQAYLMTLRDEWRAQISGPAQQAQMGMGMGMGAPGGAAPGQMTGGPGASPGMVAPNSVSGISVQQLGMGPGSQTGVQGGPPPGGSGNPMSDGV